MFQYCSAVGYDDDVFMKKCMDYEVEGVEPRCRPTRTWKEEVEADVKKLKMK